MLLLLFFYKYTVKLGPNRDAQHRDIKRKQEAQHHSDSNICGYFTQRSEIVLLHGGKRVRRIKDGWEGHKFMRKLKFVKPKLPGWNKGIFGDLRKRKFTITLDIGRIDRLEQEGNLSQNLIALRNLRRKELGGVLLNKEVHWRQSSRIKWIKEGDSNSKFFHRVANGRRKKKFINSLVSEEGETPSGSDVISEEILNFFGRLSLNPKETLGG